MGQSSRLDAKARKKAPAIVNMFETKASYPFVYTGHFSDAVVDVQWRQQIKNNVYSKIHFEEHMAGSTESTIHLKTGSTTAIDIEMPATITGEYPARIKRAQVNFFSNNVGIANLTFQPLSLETESGEKDKSAQFARSTIQDVLALQQAVLGNDTIMLKLDNPVLDLSKEQKRVPGACDKAVTDADKDGEAADGHLYETSVKKLFESLIDDVCCRNKHVEGWKRLPVATKPFILNKVEIDFDEQLHSEVGDLVGGREPSAGSAAPISQIVVQSAEPEEEKAPPARGWTWGQQSTWTYALSSFAWTESLNLQDQFLEDYTKKNCYLRFATDAGGLWFGFRSNGGSAVYFHYNDITGKKMHADWMDNQNQWPPATEIASQLVAPLIYQRTFLQVEVQRIRKLISRTADVNSYHDMHHFLSELKDIEGRLLRFNIKFCDEISQEMAAKEVFAIWQQLEALNSLKENLVDHVQELSAFYRNMSTATQQDKLDLLTVMVVMLGLAQIMFQGIVMSHTPLAVLITAGSLGTALYYHDTVLNRSVFNTNLHVPFAKLRKAALKQWRLMALRVSKSQVLLVTLVLACAAGGLAVAIETDSLPLTFSDKTPFLYVPQTEEAANLLKQAPIAEMEESDRTSAEES